MTVEVGVEKSSDWKKFIRKHWNIFAIFLVAIILAFAGAIYVFLWFVKDAQSTSLVPSILGMWSMANVVSFILNAIFWELVLIGIPVVIGAILGWQWWKRLSDEEKREYNLFGKGSRSRRAGGAAPPSLFIAFVIKVYVDGNWNMPISTYTLDYVVGSMVTLLIATAVIFGIPAIIGLILWLRHGMNKKP
jgi:Sec-independent protein secretion pathway component TatC